ncbi:endoplasmic reticulum-Golgi intermediate compartment protein 2 [Hydra vulgaris]|uniref:Endoplasmic reticulum-Golgi intermediate compartment protein 2 n=1 Tax=Hydra vulgaris TaxID=6087 RepID=A0ABM4BL47_HYDVU
MQSLSEGIRQRKTISKGFKDLDAFPKIPESYQETSASGGTVSILVFLFISMLVISEFIYYSGSILTYKYEVDKEADNKFRINIDITVAMECDDIGADVLDLSGGNVDTGANLHLTPAHFSMSSNQKQWWDAFRSARKSDEGYRSINKVTQIDMIFGDVMPTYMPDELASEFEGKEFDGCRIYGNIEVNKVAGNFHITAGKSIPHPRGHAHLSALVSELNYNFSHRIDMLSFGEPHPGIINPLDGDLMITTTPYHMYQYYIAIVPTTIQTLKNTIKTNQYSVTQRSRQLNLNSGSQGVPGIFFKYDFNAISVSVNEERRSFNEFLIRLCGIIGGVFATSGMLHSAIGALADIILCQMRQKRGKMFQTTNNVQKEQFECKTPFVLLKHDNINSQHVSLVQQ